MPTELRIIVRILAVCTLIAGSTAVSAEEPDLKTPSPFIYLADNLDEKDKLGWCIDTLGRGYAEKIQAHSCKPRGGDVQFDFNEKTRAIESVAFAGKCLTLVDQSDPKIPFGLRDCKTGETSQMFDFNFQSMQIRPESDKSLCLAVAPDSRSAGPFMSRDLTLAPCDGTEPRLLQWKRQTN